MRIIKKLLKYSLFLLLAIIVGIVIWLVLPMKAGDYDDTPREDTEYWNLPTGSKIAYTHLEPPMDTVLATIVYLHGGPGGYINTKTLEAYRELAQRGYEVYLYDQIGCGLSARLADPEEYTLTRHVKDLEAIVGKVNAERTVLIGQSWGASLASNYVVEHPGTVDQLVLSSPGGIVPEDSITIPEDSEVLIAGLTNIDERTEAMNAQIEGDLSAKEMALTALGLVFGNPNLVGDDKLDAIFHDMSKDFVSGMVCDTANAAAPSGRPGMYSQLYTNKSHKNSTHDLRAKLRELDIPVLVLKPECDYIDWRVAYEYAQLIDGAELKVIPNAGHSIYTENRADYLAAIHAFLSPTLPDGQTLLADGVEE